MKIKTTTERLFNKENVFKWIETLEDAILALSKLKSICAEQRCGTCMFVSTDFCPILTSNETSHEIEKVLNRLYTVVEKNKWEDEE